jgi:flagellar motor switch protein FliM
MAEELLSQAELETLLSAMEFGPGAAPSDSAARDDKSGDDAASASRPNSVPYDFKRPRRASGELLRALGAMHEPLAREFATALSAMTRAGMHVNVAAVEETTYGGLTGELECPTCLTVVRPPTNEGPWLLNTAPTILYPIIDRLLGGGRQPTAIVRRPLTEIETRLAGRVTAAFLELLAKTWRSVLAVELAVDRVESNPLAPGIMLAGEGVVVIRFELALGNAFGAMRLAIPFPLVSRLADAITRRGWSVGAAGSGSPKLATGALKNSVVELVANLAEARVRSGDLLELRVGDIITTKKDVRAAIEVSLDGVPKFRAQPGALKGHKAIAIDELVEPGADGG